VFGPGTGLPAAKSIRRCMISSLPRMVRKARGRAAGGLGQKRVDVSMGFAPAQPSPSGRVKWS